MNGQGQTVLGAGLALIVVNAWTSNQRQALTGVLNGDTSDETAGHQALYGIGGETVLILVMAFVADSSTGYAGSTMIVVIVGLWLLWAIRYYSSKSNAGAKVTPATHAPAA